MTRIQQIRIWTVAAVLAASSLRCSGGDVGPTDPVAIAMISGSGQTGTAGQVLPNPLVVEVTDKSGNPVPGVSVGWSAQGGGSVSSTSVKTGSDGHASVQRTLGPTLGEQTTIATASSLDGSPVTFVATAASGAPGVAVVTQPPASALSGEVFDPTAQPVVSVGDDGGSPVAGVDVTASVASGATLEGKTTATTNASGIATFGDLGIRGTGSFTIKFTAAAASASSNSITVSTLSTQATMGSWGPVVNWDIVPLHMSLLPTGKILAWGKTEHGTTCTGGVPCPGMPRLWDPSTGQGPLGAPEVHVDTMLFCAGHTLMANGTLMVSGGHKADDTGINVTNLFNQDGVWQGPNTPKMAHGRWYPTVTVLPDGSVLSMAGRDENANVVTIPELWDGTQWTELTGASAVNIPYYPRNFVAPDGRIFYAGERVMSRWFSVTGSGSWSNGPSHIWPFNREYGSAVMYEAGKILYVGGGGDRGWVQNPDPLNTRSAAPTATAETIDLTKGSPSWQPAGSMSVPRRHLNATILPDGTVLVTGGTKGGGFDDVSDADAARAAEIWDPRVGQTGKWTTLASSSVTRVYHSVSMLLPNGTVLHGASGNAMVNDNGQISPAPDRMSHEIFSPPYMFKGVQPTITSAPGTVNYMETFEVATPNKAQVTDVRWIRLGSVTHAFDAGQRANTLSFSPTPNGVSVIAPANPNLAPPGYYMLFILNRNGVPSEGKIIKVQ